MKNKQALQFFGGLLLALPVTAALAQSVQQSGTVTVGQASRWVSNGIIGTGGTAADGLLTTLGVTNANLSSFCISSARASAAGRNQLCFGTQTDGASVISVQNYGTATAQALIFRLNGVDITLPSGGGTFVTATGAFVAGHAACFVSSAGVLQDCGTGTAGQLWIGQSAAAAAWTTLSGDATLAASGALTIANSAVTVAKMANAAASSLFGNFTTSAAAPQISTIGALTQKVSPAATDLVIIQDQAASGQLKYALVSSVGAAGSVSSIAGNTGAFTLDNGITNATNAIRLDLTYSASWTGVPSFLTGANFGKAITSRATDGVAMVNSSGGIWVFEFSKVFSGTSTAIANYYNSGYVGGVDYTNTATNFVTSSDRRLKKNINDLAKTQNVGVLIDKLRPVFFNWRSDDSADIGFIAQDLAPVAPTAVKFGDNNSALKSDDPKFVPWGTDATKLMPYVIAELQSLRARIAILESK